MVKTLKPCPFCNEQVKTKEQKIHDDAAGIQFFYCDNFFCGAVVSFRQPNPHKDKLWNRRQENDKTH